MLRVQYTCLALALATLKVAAAPAGTSASGFVAPTFAYPAPASQDPNDSLMDEFQNGQPEPIRGNLGAKILGPDNLPLDRLNPDLIMPPTTDHGSVSNARWPMDLSHNRVQFGGWARQQNAGVMPIADSIAGVNMRLEAGAVRELHWHSAAEWGYMLAGNATITAVDSQGRNYISDIQVGDIWYFPAGIPHSIQGLEGENNQGCEFLLVFDDGNFSEDETFLVTDWMAHVPMEVLSKSLQLEQEALKELPGDQLWIFPADVPPAAAQQAVKSPNGEVPEPFGFEFSKVTPMKVGGGTVKVVDTRTFPVSQTISAAEVTVEAGGMRELHWHPTQDEWSFFLEGEARITLFGAQSNARTFNYQPGDVGFVPNAFGHYVENIGNTTLRFLEIFKSSKYEDVSLTQWLALTPPALVKAHLRISDDSISKLSKDKAFVVGPLPQ